ncbi:MAG: hypothetical protein M3264_09250 [Thermoproteota archaeon]|nr:hypothetical protein [Thermoproteota archaeon]
MVVSYSCSAAKRGITAITGVITNGLHGRMNVADAVSYSSVLLLNLSDNILKPISDQYRR